MRRLMAVAGLVLMAGTAEAQGLVGRWEATTMAVNRQTGEQVQLRAAITFAADSTFSAQLTSDDGSGEPGASAVTTGEFRVRTDPWGGTMICVIRADRREPAHCQAFRVNGDRLAWGNVVFTRLPGLQQS